MFAVLSNISKSVRRFALVAAMGALAACDASLLDGLGGSPLGGPNIDPSKPVPVALLVPKSDSGASGVARSIENATRLAISELNGVQIDLRVYDTAGSSSTAAAQAQRAVDEGAKIILGPLFGEAANAAGLAVLDEGINVLSFSNNATIAGGNVYVLGPTFNNTAERLMGYARRQGHRAVVVVHSNDVPGAVGRGAIETAALNNGINVASVHGYSLSVEGVNATARAAAGAATSTGANSIFITTDASNAALPMFLQILPEAGVNSARTKTVGLTRWDTKPELFGFPGAQGAWFALPNQSSQNAFEQRYRAKHGSTPHPLAGLGFDGIAAIGALVAQGRRDALTGKALTNNSGFRGTGGIFRLRADGTNQRALAIATVQNNKMVILDPAPNNFGGAGF